VWAHGLDDAANWTIKQTADSAHFKGMGRNLQGVLVPFDSGPFHPTPPDDGPKPRFLEQISGLKEIFYIDGPGLPNIVSNIFNGLFTPGLLQVDSMTIVQNFTAHLCRTDNSKSCHVLPWFVKIIVNPGALSNPQTSIDTVNSDAGPGRKPIIF